MTGMDETTGKLIDTKTAIDNAIKSIIFTKIGTRPLNREYGSNVIDFLDKPISNTWRLEISAEIIKAVSKWEKRFKILTVLINMQSENASIDIVGEYIINGQKTQGRVSIETN